MEIKKQILGNGRRAWRKRARLGRRALVRECGSCASVPAGCERRHQNTWAQIGPDERYWRPLEQVGPFTARSLVGMSMGARKRASLAEWRKRKAEGLASQYLRLPWPSAFSEFALFQGLRLQRRIGERLRPCPGCLACQHLRTCTACENAEFEGYRCENCGRVHVVQRICDGAGVLPAKRGRR